jgi:ATP-dependent Zn protease
MARAELEPHALAAYHEAGHAVVITALGGHVASATIVPEVGPGGRVLLGHVAHTGGAGLPASEGDVFYRIERLVAMAMAGAIAVAIAEGARHADWWKGAQDDWADAERIATWRAPDDHERALYLRWCEARTWNLLTEHWPAVERVAEALVLHETLDHAQLVTLIAAAAPALLAVPEECAA